MFDDAVQLMKGLFLFVISNHKTEFHSIYAIIHLESDFEWGGFLVPIITIYSMYVAKYTNLCFTHQLHQCLYIIAQ